MKKNSYFFEIIKTNNKIRNLINEYDNENDIPESERENVMLYLNNRGDIFMNKITGYFRYRRGDIYKYNGIIKSCNINLSNDNPKDMKEIYLVFNISLNINIQYNKQVDDNNDDYSIEHYDNDEYNRLLLEDMNY